MERFLKIDWNPLLEDVIDDSFINEERLERESIMHRILMGNLKDPFADIINDYETVDVDLLGDDQDELDDSANSSKEKKNIQQKKCEQNEKKTYVPGVVKSKFKFPKKSNLSKEQQAMCLRVLLKFSESDKPKITQADREELKKYLDLQSIISEEQDDFLKFVKSKWSSDTLKIKCEKYINQRWKSKLEYIHRLPQYYAEIMNIPFVASKSIAINCVRICSEIGDLPSIKLPTFLKPCRLNTNSEQLIQRFPPKNNKNDKPSVFYNLPVSEDSRCQQLAEENTVDLVISSSGFKCLVNNIESSYSNSWILPVVVKTHGDMNIVYIDKSAPPTASTIPEKNTWIYKYILRQHLVKPARTMPKKKDASEPYNDDIFEDSNYDSLLKLEDEYEDNLWNIEKGSNLSISTRDSNTEETLTKQFLEKDKSPCSIEVPTNSKENYLLNVSNNSIQHEEEEARHENAGNEKISEPMDQKKKESVELNGSHVSYKLFTIGSKCLEKNELMKNSVVNTYKILIRTKDDGVETFKNGTQCSLTLAPKLEHQVALGAEAVTLEEALKQWISLIIRPNTYLARVRISAETSEILQIERRTEKSVSNEIQRLYSVKVEDSLTVVHNVIQSLKTLTPGRYIMRHTIRNGAFATVFKEVDKAGKNIFDLHTVYGGQFPTIPICPWRQIDKTVATPMLKVFERMPAMFYPSNFVCGIKKTYKKLKSKKFETVKVRRSLRNRERKLLKIKEEK